MQYSDPFLTAAWLIILFTALALSALVLWRRFRSRRELMRRVAELEALSAAGRAIVAAELDMRALVELIAVEFGQVIDTRTFQIGLFAGDRYQIMHWQIDGQMQAPQTFDLRENPGLVGWIRQEQQPVLVRDFERELDRLPARPRYVSDRPARSGIFIPLISGGQAIGIVAAQSNQPNQFDEDDLRRLTILANQAAAGIANARLYEQERQRALRLEMVGKIAQEINAIHDLDELLGQIVYQVRSSLYFHPVNIFRFDDVNQDLVIQASSLTNLAAGSVRLAVGQGLVGAAAATRTPVVVNEVGEDERFLARAQGMPGTLELNTRAEIAIPLLAEAEFVGVLDVQSTVPGVFTPEEVQVLAALAAQLGTAIHRARQVAIQREQAWLTAAQLQVADAISHSADLEELVDAITRLTPLLVGVRQCGILLWNDDLQAYEGRRVYGLEKAAMARFEATRLAVGQWTPLDAVHVGLTGLVTQQLPPWNNPRQAAPLLLLPLLAKGRMLGVMVVDTPPAAELTMREKQDELLRNIAAQVGLAVEANLLDLAQQEEAWVNTALLQVAEAVNRLFDLNEILDTIVRFVPMLVGVRSCVVLIWDEANGVFHAGPCYGLSEMGRGLLLATEIERDEFLSVVEQAPDERAPSTTYYSIELPTWLRTILETQRALAFQLRARERLVGIMLVGPTADRRPVSGRRLSILTGIAHQAATAVVNNHLYKESAEREKLARELEVAHSIQSSLIPAGSPDIPGCDVASYWQAARQVSGDFYDFLPLPTGRWGIVIADVADKGFPAALFMALSRTILRTVAFNRDHPAETLMRVNDLLFNDSQSDLFVTVFYAVWDAEAETLTYANGGHNPPLLIRQNGRTQQLKTSGIALGVLAGVKIEQKKVKLMPGDLVVFYTDGVTEAINEDYDEFGVERLRLTAAALKENPAAEIVAAITDAVADHTGDSAQFDDITLVVLKRPAQ